MGRNKKTSKRMSALATNTLRTAAALGALFAVAILDMLASSSCNQLVKRADAAEKKLQRRVADLESAQARWDAVRSSGNLDRALVKWGLDMRLPAATQIVRMDAKGAPLPGQMSVALVRQRNADTYRAQAAAPVLRNER